MHEFDLRRDQAPEADFAVANILASPLRAWAASQIRLPPNLILGGLLEPEADEIAAVYAARGLRERERRLAGGWAALQLTAGP